VFNWLPFAKASEAIRSAYSPFLFFLKKKKRKKRKEKIRRKGTNYRQIKTINDLATNHANNN